MFRALFLAAFSLLPLLAQPVSYAPIQIPADPATFYVGEGYFDRTVERGKTNYFRIFSHDLSYGDKVRVRTIGTFATDEPGGSAEWTAEQEQPIVGYLASVVLHPNRYYLPFYVEQSSLPPFVTPPVEIAGKPVPTDVDKDFLITKDGITFCIPVDANFLGFVNSVPGINTKDENRDFAVEIVPLEKTRPRLAAILSRTNVTVGDPVEMTLTVTNIGNVPAQNVSMFLPAELANRPGFSVMQYDTNLVREISGPIPATFGTIPPGGSAQVRYAFHSIGPGTNLWLARVGHLICGDTMFQSMSSLATPLVIEPVIDITLREPDPSTFTKDSLEAGQRNVDAPLRFVAETAVLADVPEFEGTGLVADGVTPLLLRAEIAPDKLERYPNGVTVRAEASMAIGDISGESIDARLEVLQDGEWRADGTLTLDKETPFGHFALRAILSDELKIPAGQVEVVIRIDLKDDTGLALGRIRVPVRRPPIALIHGYNTKGDWGADFVKDLTASRDVTFVRTARYGMTEITSSTTGHDAAVNTLWPLRNLAPLAERALEDAIAPVRAGWLMTRYDVVAHSQGGLLTRMLSSLKGNNHVTQPWRNETNLFRGRFHRVVTIGSPHNGTRLLHYLLALNRNKGDAVPNWVGYGMVESNFAQEKFDPWGPQIRELNDPSANALWTPDPAARFHMVRTTILGGQNFTPNAFDCPAMWALGLTTAEAGRIVVGEGSDGVVDYNSMLAIGPGQSASPENAYTVPPRNDISHAFFEAPKVGEIFGATSGQVLSRVVSTHVIAALDQSTSIPPEERIFGAFQVPALMDDATREAIDTFARGFHFDVEEMRREQGPALRSLADAIPIVPATVTQDFKLRIRQPDGKPVSGQVLWIAELYGTNGITGQGLQILQPTTNPLELTVRLAARTYGDVVLQGAYATPEGGRVFLKPLLVATVSPPGVTATGLRVSPGDATRQPAGLDVPVQIWTTWSDGRTSRRFLSPENVSVLSLAPSVVDVSNPLLWRTVAPGQADLTVNFDGQTAPLRWTVFAPDAAPSPSIALTIDQAGPTTITLSWPAAPAAPAGLRLQSTPRLGSDASWSDLPENPTLAAERFTLALPTSPVPQFFRLRQNP